MNKWILSIIAGAAGAAAGLWFSKNYMHAKLFLGGIEVDLSDPTAVEWALANPAKSEWLTYLTFGQDVVLTQPGSYWMTAVPVAFAVLLFAITFLMLGYFSRPQPETKNPFQKAPSSSDSAAGRKADRLTGGSGEAGAAAKPVKSAAVKSATVKSGAAKTPNGVGADEPLAAVNGTPAKLNGSAELKAEPSGGAAEAQESKAPEAPRGEEAEESVQVEQDKTAKTPEKQAEEPTAEKAAQPAAQEEAVQASAEEPAQETAQDTAQDTAQEAAPESEIRVEASAPEAAESPEGNPEVLDDEAWKTHYDYLDSVRMIFDKLKSRSENMAVDFATRYMVDPKGADLEAIVAQIVEEERQRNRFSQNDEVEAAHVAMMEFSADAAAEFRRVVRILGEDVDLASISQKIRQRFPKATSRSGIDPYQMNESQVITELRGRGFEIIAPAGGPYSVKDDLGSRVTKPFNLLELQEFLKEQRSL